MVPDWSAPAQQFFDDDEAVDGGGVATAVTCWDRHTDPATLGQRGGELWIDLSAHPEAGLECPPGQRFDQEGTNLLPQFQLWSGERGRRRDHTWRLTSPRRGC